MGDMWRTISFVVLLFISIFWLPWYLTMGIFTIALIVCRYSVVFLIPALAMDFVYASHTGTFFHNHLTLLLVMGGLCVRYFVITRTRVTNL